MGAGRRTYGQTGSDKMTEEGIDANAFKHLRTCVIVLTHTHTHTHTHTYIYIYLFIYLFIYSLYI